MIDSTVIRTGTITVLDHRPTYNRDNWTLGPGALEYCDQALLAYCGYTPCFGGTVERGKDHVLVSVYTD